MSNEITIQDVSNMSVAFAKSGFFGYKNSSEAFTLMCLAQANGLHPAKAAERYHIIQGRPAMKADAMLAAFQESGGKVRWTKRTDAECTLHLEHPQGGELDVTWTIERANAAGLIGKNTWKQYPTQMLSARCVSEGVRALYPACLCGMYTPEEVSDFAPAKTAPAPEFTPAEVVAEPATANDSKSDKLWEEKSKATSTSEDKRSGDKRKQGFVLAMQGLIQRNKKVAYAALGAHGYEKPEDVPLDKIDDVYRAVRQEFEK